METLDEDFSNFRSLLNLPDLSDQIWRHFKEESKRTVSSGFDGENHQNIARKFFERSSSSHPHSGEGYPKDGKKLMALHSGSGKPSKLMALHSSSGKPGKLMALHSSSGKPGKLMALHTSSGKPGKLMALHTSSGKPGTRTYQGYMSELSQLELDLIYTAYYDDFKIFNYNPNE